MRLIKTKEKKRLFEFKVEIPLGLFFITLLFCFISVVMFGYFSFTFCKNQNSGFSRMGTSPVLNKEKISQGYTLFTTMGIYKGKTKDPVRISLVDLYGKAVHSWFTNFQPFDSQLTKNGDLLVLTWPSGEDGDFNKKDASIIKLDWNSKLIWAYKNDLLHHDFEILPNGNIAALVYDQVPSSIAAKVKGGIWRSESQDKVISDSIIEVNDKGEKVWKWDLYTILNVENDRIGDLDLHSEWTHSNSIRYLEKNPINGEPAYLISVRNLNFVAIISRNNGKVIWKSPKGMLDHQHDASILDNGHILVFDNGYTEHAKEYGLLESKVKEIDPKLNKVVWQLGGADYSEKLHFFSPTFGSAQKLRNGNILVGLGIDGEMMEVTPNKEIVWDLINPYYIANQDLKTNFFDNYFYRAKRIYFDQINWPSKISFTGSFLYSFCRQ